MGNLPALQETQEMWVQSLRQEEPLEEEMATYSSILACGIPWTEEEPGGLVFGSQKVRHDWVTEWACTHGGSLDKDLITFEYISFRISCNSFWKLIACLCKHKSELMRSTLKRTHRADTKDLHHMGRNTPKGGVHLMWYQVEHFGGEGQYWLWHSPWEV